MKSFYLILFLTLFSIAELQSQPTFQRTYPFTNPVIPVNFITTPEGNFVIYATSNDCIFLMKINPAGDTIWTRKLLVNFFDLNDMILLHDSGFAITGSWDNGVAVIKLDQSGDSLWMQHYSYQTQYGPSGRGLSILETDDHGFFLLNSHDDTDIVYYDIQFLKLDSLGNFLWEKSYNLGHDIITPGFMMKLSSSSYLVQVRRHMGGPSIPYGRLMQVDTSGNILLNFATAETGREGGDFIGLTTDSNYFMVGNTRSFWDDDPYGVLYKLNMSGTISWNIPFPGTSAMKSLAVDFAGGCIVACDSFQFPFREFQLKRFDTNGQLLASNTYPIDHHETANAVHSTPDSGFMAVGYHQMPSGQIEMYIVKTDSTGMLNTNGYEITSNDSLPCEGDTVTLSVQSAAAYLWSDGQTSQSINITEDGSYNVSVVDSLGATYYTTFVQFSFLPAPEVDFGADASLCTGNNLVLDPGFFASYLWQDSSTVSTYTVTSGGVYSVTVTAANGCSAADTIQVFEFPLPVIALGNDTGSCMGSLIVLHAGSGFAGYQWQDHSTDSVYIASLPGNYFVSVIDTNGCTSSDTIALSFYQLPEVTLSGDTLLCINQSIFLDAGPGYTTYLWQDGSSMQTFTGTSSVPDSIFYSVLVTDSNSCVGGDSIMVVFDACAGITSSVENGIVISPNPFDKYIRIQLPSNFKDADWLTIFNSTGTQVDKKYLRQDEFIDVSELPEGIYFLVIQSGDQIILGKAIKMIHP